MPEYPAHFIARSMTFGEVEGNSNDNHFTHSVLYPGDCASAVEAKLVLEPGNIQNKTRYSTSHVYSSSPRRNFPSGVNKGHFLHHLVGPMLRDGLDHLVKKDLVSLRVEM